jgi:hypothetical protein
MTRYVCGIDNRYRGVCNSHRGEYKLVTPGIRTNEFSIELGSDMNRRWDNMLYARYRFELKSGISDASATWKIKIPVIAEPGTGAAACSGVIPGTSISDPNLAANKNYTIIGFVDLIVYDVDMGEPPPSYPILKVDESGTEPFPEEMRFQEPCNNVRARITCESQFVPSSVPGGYAAPRLVTSE